MLTILTPSPEQGLHERVLQLGHARRLTRVNLSQVLAQYLMEVSVPDRVRAVQEFGLGVAGGCLLDHIEILFDPQLQVHPLRWLDQRAKDRGVYVVWPGDFDTHHVSYAVPGHPEHQKFDLGGFAAIKTECI